MSFGNANMADNMPFIFNNLSVKVYGAGRGNRTPMELPPTDFEFAENTVRLPN
jgi:hypothetical protein